MIDDERDIEFAWSLYSEARAQLEENIDLLTSTEVNPDGEEYYSKIHLARFSPLTELANLLNGYDTTAYGSYLEDETEIAPAALSKLIKGQQHFSASSAIKILDSFKTLLTTIENNLAQTNDGFSANTPQSKSIPHIDLNAEKWVPKSESAEVGKLIEKLTRHLEEIVDIFQRNNSLAELDGVNQLRIERLRSVLKTTLKLLDAPLIETGILKKASDLAGVAGKEFAKDEMKQGLSRLLNMVSDEALKIYLALTNP